MSGKLTYKQSGVDTKEAAAFVSDISSHVKRTQKQRSLHQAFGLFAAAYDLSSYKEPVIVTGCDGVGTKTEILFELDMVETAGKDLVAMNVNDILTTGGDPLLHGTGQILAGCLVALARLQDRSGIKRLPPARPMAKILLF